MAIKEIFASNEVVGAMISHNVAAEDLKGLESDPKNFLLSNVNVDLQIDAKFNLVENSGDTINLALPYYSEVKAMAAAELTTEQLEGVAGGEIIGFIIAACSVVGATVASAVGVSSIGAGAAAVVGGAVIAGAATAGAVGTAAVVGGTAAGVAAGVRGSQGKTITGKKK